MNLLPRSPEKKAYPSRLSAAGGIRPGKMARLHLEQMQYQVGRYDYMVLLLWLMCHEQDSQLKRETFDRWLNEAGIRGVIPLITAVGEAMQAAFPDTDEDEADPAGAGTAADPT